MKQVSHLHRTHHFICSMRTLNFCLTVLARPLNIWNYWQMPKDCKFQPNIISSKDGISGKAGSITVLWALSQPILSKLKSPTHSLKNQLSLQAKTSHFWLLLRNFIWRSRMSLYVLSPSPAHVHALCFSWLSPQTHATFKASRATKTSASSSPEHPCRIC